MDNSKTGVLSVTCALSQAKARTEKIHDLAGQETDIFDQIAKLIESIRDSQAKFSG